MDYINDLLSGLLTPLNEDDQAFVKGYWDVVLKTMLSPNQRKLEADLSYDILTTQTYTKSFYESFVPVAETVTYTVKTLPLTLPRNLYDLKVTGPTYKKYDTVTLPCKIDDATNVVTDNPDVIVDGNILLGEGTCEVMYDTNVILDYTYSTLTGVFDSTKNVTQVVASKGDSTTEILVTPFEMFHDRVVYCPHITLKHAKVGQSVTIQGRVDTIASIIDNHRFTTTRAHCAPGRTGTLKIDLYPYAYATEWEDIPEFDNGWVRDVDYKMFDGKICFPEPVTEPIIAKRVFNKNRDLYDRFMKHLYVRPEDESLYLPFWRSIFTNNMEAFLYAAIGYPYILPEMGDMRVHNIEHMRKDIKHTTSFTYDPDNMCRVTVPDAYFDGTENAVLLEDGQFLKILHHVTETEVEVERPLITGTQDGYAAHFTISSLTLEDENGLLVYFRVPPHEFPIVKVGDIIPPWTPLVTGLKVFDRTENSRYEVYESTDRFVVDDGVAVPSDANILLKNNTFVIMSSEPLNVSENILRFLMPSWAQYHKIDQRSDVVSFSDISTTSVVASLVFKKFLPTEVLLYTPTIAPTPYLVHQAMIDPYMPMEFLGTYDVMNPLEITDLKWLSGAPLDISGFTDISRVIEAFGVDPASHAAVAGVHIDVTSGADKLIIDPGTAVWPTPGIDVHFSFVLPLKIISADFTASRGGECQDLMSAGELVERVHNGNQMYFLNSWADCDFYLPAIYSFTDIGISDETGGAFEWVATNGTGITADKLVGTDFERLGVRPYMTYVHNTDILQVASFDDYGQPVLSAVPVHGILASDFGFYCFVAEKDDGTIRKN
jgi:hypothetical protein